jgi:hypothetical protein
MHGLTSSKTIAFALMIICVASCSRKVEVGIEPLPAADPLAIIPAEFRIIETHWRDQCDRGHVRRSFRGVWVGPGDNAVIQTTVKRLYADLAADIERSCPEATNKLIRIVLFTEQESGNIGGPFVHVESAEGPMILPWPPKLARIDNRDWDNAPSSELVALLRSLTDARNRAAMDAESAGQGFEEQERAREHGEAEWLKQNGMTNRDLNMLSAHWIVWTSGAKTDATAIAAMFKSLEE